MSSIPMTVVLIPVFAYLLGSIPFGLILGKIFASGDVRKEGSGNIGATNVARVAGPLAGILTLLLDGAKGAAAVLLSERYSNGSALWMIIAGLAALIGHCFPIWLKFKGGKGVATAACLFWWSASGATFRSALSRRLPRCPCCSIFSGRRTMRRRR
jgi:glycerol-3-phosphate acyltransferase PlsY